MKLQISTKKIPKVDSNHTFLAMIMLDSSLKKVDNHFLQVFLKECNILRKN